MGCSFEFINKTKNVSVDRTRKILVVEKYK